MCVCVLDKRQAVCVSGIGSGSAPLEQCIELAQRPGVLPHWTLCRHLIIDEVSMVDAPLFDKLEAIARYMQLFVERQDLQHTSGRGGRVWLCIVEVETSTFVDAAE